MPAPYHLATAVAYTLVVITFWIIVAIAVAVWIYIIANAIERGMAVFFGGFCITAATIIVLLVADLILEPLTGYHWDYYNVPLVAITDDRSETGGSFFLGSGSIGTDTSYVFYTANPDGSHTLYQTKAHDIKVFEDTDKPYARYEGQQVLDHPNWVPPLASWLHFHHAELVEFHVPPHSIKTGINLGVQQR
jgi:hypothetical protein